MKLACIFASGAARILLLCKVANYTPRLISNSPKHLFCTSVDQFVHNSVIWLEEFSTKVIASRWGLTEFSLFHGNIQKETDTEKFFRAHLNHFKVLIFSSQFKALIPIAHLLFVLGFHTLCATSQLECPKNLKMFKLDLTWSSRSG